MEKQYYQQIYQQLTKSVAKISDLTTGRANLTGEVAHFGEEIAKIEGFLRLLWGEAFNTAGREEKYFQDLCEGILNGVNSSSKHFWGDIPDYGQLFVEMVALSIFLIESKPDFWDKLANDEKEAIASYMNQITEANLPLNNWQFFKVMVQVAFCKLGSRHFSKEALVRSLAFVHSYYRDEGFYTDGDNNSKDYYISWAFHYYGLLYDRYMSEFDPETSAIFVERTNAYLPAYLAHFDNDGIAVPYGRSLAYRFAQGALLSMLALSNKIQVDSDILGRLLSGHLNYWINSDILKPDGTLSVGYTYPNIQMAESYNSAGSPYWAFKFFVILGCHKEDSVFTPQISALKLGCQAFKTGNYIAERTLDQTFFYPVNNTATTDGYKDKYHKFVYSSKFGFSVSKGLLHLHEGIFDNTLAIKDLDTGLFLTKRSEETFQLLEDRLIFTWSPKNGIQIKTTIIPRGNQHRRVHEIKTELPVKIYDIGFANDALDANKIQVIEDGNRIEVRAPYGITVSENVLGYDELLIQHTMPSTHLLFKKAIISGLKASVEAGKYRFESVHSAYYKGSSEIQGVE